MSESQVSLATVGIAPIGSIIAWAGPLATLPTGWRLCNGDPLDRMRPENRALFDAMGTTWGGDGANNFNLPDLQGLFLRGVSAESGRDSDADRRVSPQPAAASPGNQGNAVGSMQDDAFQSHRHAVTLNRDMICGSNGSRDCEEGEDKFNTDPSLGRLSVLVGDATPADFGEPRTAPETRPKNAFVYWIIRWR
jgi:microcystin-dependent protein